MIKYKLAKIVKKDGSLMNSTLIKMLSEGTYIIMNDDDTAVLSLGTAGGAKPINVKVEGENFTIGPIMKLPFKMTDEGNVIEYPFQGDTMFLVNEALLEAYMKVSEAKENLEDKEKALEIAQIKEQDIKLTPRRFILLGKIFWNEDGSQEMVKATEKEVIEFYGGDDGYDDKHYVYCSCKGHGDGTWEKSETVRGEYDVYFGSRKCSSMFEEAGTLVYLYDGENTYHFLQEGAEMPTIARLNWEE